MTSRIAMLLLAAGASTRLGSPKQMLVYQGQTLLRRAAEQAFAAGCSPVCVVLGSSAALLRIELKDLPVTIIENPHWQNGMGTSLRAGIAHIAADNQIQAALIGVCDQPLIDAAALAQFIDAYTRTTHPLIAAAYAKTLGVPALFAKEFFPALLTLPDTHGAKHLLLQHQSQVLLIPLPDAAIDIDIPTDRENLRKNS